MIQFTSKGSFAKTESFFARMVSHRNLMVSLHTYGQQGVAALSAATPVDSSLTAQSWTYEVTEGKGGFSIVWRNTNVVDGMPVAILLQYGHGTGSGGYIQGRDYINPVIMPIFDQIANDVWRVVTTS